MNGEIMCRSRCCPIWNLCGKNFHVVTNDNPENFYLTHNLFFVKLFRQWVHSTIANRIYCVILSNLSCSPMYLLILADAPLSFELGQHITSFPQKPPCHKDQAFGRFRIFKSYKSIFTRFSSSLKMTLWEVMVMECIIHGLVINPLVLVLAEHIINTRFTI